MLKWSYKNGSKNSKKIECKSKEEVLAYLKDFISKGCLDNQPHKYHRLSFLIECTGCEALITFDESIMEKVNLNDILRVVYGKSS